MSNVLTVLSVPDEAFGIMFPGKSVRDETDYYAAFMGVLAVIAFIGMFA